MKKAVILLSTFNGEKYINELIDSLLKQDYFNYQILIRDDGSIDNTCNILKKYENENKKMLKVFYGENIGVNESFFKLIEIAKGMSDYYFLCDQDDVWLDNKIKNAIELMEKYNEPVTYCSKQTKVDELLNVIGETTEPIHELTFENAIIENVITGCTLAINDKMIQFILPSKEAVFHDWWIYLVSTTFGKVIFDEHSYILYRQHDSNVVGASDWNKKINNGFKRIIFTNGNQISIQAISFFEIYSKFLNLKDFNLLHDFIDNYSKNFLIRIIYVHKTSLYRQKKYDSFIFKILYVLKKI